MTPAEARRRRGLVLDTNLFLVYVVGLVSPGLISGFKRTAAYTESDFLRLATFMGRFQRVTTTPHILTEVTDLLETLNRSRQHRPFYVLRQSLARFEELYFPSLQLADSQPKRFDKFGLADSMLAELAAQDYLILTDDLPLFGYLENLGLPVVNFNHLRSQQLLE